MNPEREFDRRIASIHGLDSQVSDGRNIGEDDMDIRHAEFRAMADVFLGNDFDRSKLAQVESLQLALHERQAELYQQYETGELDPEQYVESYNSLLRVTFAKCETILGFEHFQKLFGAPRSELAGFIDKQAFLQAHQTSVNRR